MSLPFPKPSGPPPLVIVGASGLIGTALVRAAGTAREVIPIPHAPFETLGKRITDTIGKRPSYVVICAGITNPRAPVADVQKANVALPQMILDKVAPWTPESHFLTLGTVMEQFEAACAGNNYLKSKLDLGKWIESRKDIVGKFVRHVQLHTVYGGELKHLKPYSFLGLMHSALAGGRPFPMSMGDQLREYHHVDDVASSLIKLLESKSVWEKGQPPIYTLSNGKPLKLAALATAVFEKLGKPGQLQIGAVPAAAGENRKTKFKASPADILGKPRDPQQGVIQWLEGNLKKA